MERWSRSEVVRELARQDDELVAWWSSQVECCLIGTKEEDRLRQLLGRLSDSWTEIEPSRDVRALRFGTKTRRVRTWILPPSGVNFTALLSRLTITCIDVVNAENGRFWGFTVASDACPGSQVVAAESQRNRALSREFSRPCA